MKQTILIGLACGAIMGGLTVATKKDKVIVEEVVVTHKNPEKTLIPVKVTLTKYQLQKMLNLIEEKYSDFKATPAKPQDSMTFKSSARGMGGIYEISSTQLAKYTGKVRRESEE